MAADTDELEIVKKRKKVLVEPKAESQSSSSHDRADGHIPPSGETLAMGEEGNKRIFPRKLGGHGSEVEPDDYIDVDLLPDDPDILAGLPDPPADQLSEDHGKAPPTLSLRKVRLCRGQRCGHC